jgi:D-alanyl-lipoteichoic acid acyltransferase DltB (MBOAT superfamily)
MARGISRVFGIELPNNFISPYRSTSMIEFWKRWHITLSMWIRDYLYIPLGGSRTSALRSYLNVMIAFVLSGIWHGVGLNFALWGAMHGAGVVMNRFVASKIKIHYLLGWLFTFHWVSLGWIFFANPIDSALLSLLKIGTDFRWDMIITVISNNWVWYLSTLIGLIYALWDDKVVLWWETFFQKLHFILKLALFWMVLGVVLFSHLGAVNVFIYQKF